MSANHAAFNLIFRFVENYISPIAGRISSQRHVMAIRDGFISAMPFMIVGSFLLVFRPRLAGSGKRVRGAHSDPL